MASWRSNTSLARAAHTISAFEVIQAIDGPLFITSCGPSHDGCDLTDSCTIKEPLARVNDSISGLLRSISIADLAEPSADAAVRTKRSADLVTIQQ